tara:strand:+ start:199 stop:327 length:129 start_codon:yes stop_codon:yes gene_type:complete
MPYKIKPAHILANLKKVGYQLCFRVLRSRKGNSIRIGTAIRI